MAMEPWSKTVEKSAFCHCAWQHCKLLSKGCSTKVVSLFINQSGVENTVIKVVHYYMCGKMFISNMLFISNILIRRALPVALTWVLANYLLEVLALINDKLVVSSKLGGGGGGLQPKKTEKTPSQI